MIAPQSKPVVLVTGAAGFVGSHLLRCFRASGKFDLRATDHTPLQTCPEVPFFSRELGPDTNWSQVVTGCDSIIHLGARAHITHETCVMPLSEFRRVNVHGSLSLAIAARKAGVRRFLFVSSIGVYGDTPRPGGFTEHTPLAPSQPYAISKLEAEQAIRSALESSATELVILRPSLIYGPGVPGNFYNLLRLVSSGIPLPFKGVHNRRSLLAIQNLISMLETCLCHACAAGEAFNLADPVSISTESLVTTLAQGMGKAVCQFRAPHRILVWLPFGRRLARLHKQLFEDLEVETRKVQNRLGWQPVISTQDALLMTAQWYRLTNSSRIES